MKVKKAIKKVAALGVGVSMLGATLLGATANPYDLGDYPTPFVKDGMFDGIMVVGDDAAPADIIGVTDIAMALQFASTVKEVVNLGGSGEIELGGDSVKIKRSGDLLELNEYIGNVTETLVSSDAEALKSTTVSNDKGSTDVNQYLRFNWGSATSTANMAVAKVIYSKDDDDNVGDFLWFKDGEEAFKYDIEFEEGFETDVDSSDNSLEDFEDETLHILGQDFSISSATLSPSTGKVTMDLMGGAVHDTLEEGETKTYTVEGKEYEVTALIISDWAGTTSAKVKLKVNGEVTKELTAGSTEILNDGTSLGVREVLPNEAGETSGGDIVEFYLGANKVRFEDTDTTDGSTDGVVKINEETIEDAEVNLDFTNTNNETIKMNKISYYLNVDGSGGDEPYIAEGQGLREKLDEPEGMLSDSWDITYQGLSDPGVSEISVKASGDDEYRLSFENTQGVEYSSVRFLYANAASTMTYGDDDDYLVFKQNATTFYAANVSDYTIHKSDYFVVGHNSGTDTGVSRILRLDSVDTSNNLIQLTDVGTGGAINAQYTGTWGTCTYGATGVTGDINVGGYAFTFYACNTSTSGKGQVQMAVDLDDDGTPGGEAKLVVNGGGILDLGDQATTTGYRASFAGPLQITLTTDKNNFDEAPAADETININFSVSSTTLDLDVLTNAVAGLSMKNLEDNNDISMGMTNYGVKFKEINEDNDPDTLEIEYPLGQLLPQAFVTFSKSVTVEGGSGTVTIERPQRINVGAALLASQVSDPTSTNVISVGGSCINEVTAKIMGKTYPACGTESGLSEDEAILKLYESGGKVAIVVAGWSADDTTRATRVLADYKTYQAAGTLSGNEVKVTGTSTSQFTVTPVTASAMAEETEEATE